MPMHFEIYQQIGGLLGSSQWRWRLVAPNGEVIAQGESYGRKEDCLHAIELVASTHHLTPITQVAG